MNDITTHICKKKKLQLFILTIKQISQAKEKKNRNTCIVNEDVWLMADRRLNIKHKQESDYMVKLN